MKRSNLSEVLLRFIVKYLLTFPSRSTLLGFFRKGGFTSVGGKSLFSIPQNSLL